MGKVLTRDGEAESKQSDDAAFDLEFVRKYLAAVLADVSLSAEALSTFVEACLSRFDTLHRLMPAHFFAVLPRITQVIQDAFFVASLPQQLQEMINGRVASQRQPDVVEIDVRVKEVAFIPTRYVLKKLSGLVRLLSAYEALPAPRFDWGSVSASAPVVQLQAVAECPQHPWDYIDLCLQLLCADTLQGSYAVCQKIIRAYVASPQQFAGQPLWLYCNYLHDQAIAKQLMTQLSEFDADFDVHCPLTGGGMHERFFSTLVRYLAVRYQHVNERLDSIALVEERYTLACVGEWVLALTYPASSEEVEISTVSGTVGEQWVAVDVTRNLQKTAPSVSALRSGGRQGVVKKSVAFSSLGDQSSQRPVLTPDLRFRHRVARRELVGIMLPGSIRQSIASFTGSWSWGFVRTLAAVESDNAFSAYPYLHSYITAYCNFLSLRINARQDLGPTRTVRTLLSFELENGQLAYVTLFAHLVRVYQQVADFRRVLGGDQVKPNLYHVLSNLVKTLGFDTLKLMLKQQPELILSLCREEVLHGQLLKFFKGDEAAFQFKRPVAYRRLVHLLRAADQLLLVPRTRVITRQPSVAARTNSCRRCLRHFYCCGTTHAQRAAAQIARRDSLASLYSSGRDTDGRGSCQSYLSVDDRGDRDSEGALETVDPREALFFKRQALAFFSVPMCCMDVSCVRRCVMRLWLLCCYRSEAPEALDLHDALLRDPLMQCSRATQARQRGALLAEGDLSQRANTSLRSSIVYPPYRVPAASIYLAHCLRSHCNFSRTQVAYLFAGLSPLSLPAYVAKLPAGQLKNDLFWVYLHERVPFLTQSQELVLDSDDVRISIMDALRFDAQQQQHCPSDPLISASVPVLILCLLDHLVKQRKHAYTMMQAYVGGSPTASGVLNAWRLALSALASRVLVSFSLLGLDPSLCLTVGAAQKDCAPCREIAVTLLEKVAHFGHLFGLKSPDQWMSALKAQWGIVSSSDTGYPMSGLMDAAFTQGALLPHMLVYRNPLVKQCLYTLACLHYGGKLTGETAIGLLRLMVESLHGLSDPSQYGALSFPVAVQRKQGSRRSFVGRFCLFLCCCGSTVRGQEKRLRWRITDALLKGMLETLGSFSLPRRNQAGEGGSLLARPALGPLNFSLESTRRDLATQDISNRCCAFFKRHPVASGLAGVLVLFSAAVFVLYNIPGAVSEKVRQDPIASKLLLVFSLCVPIVLMGNKLIHHCRVKRAFAQLSHPDADVEEVALKTWISAL